MNRFSQTLQKFARSKGFWIALCCILLVWLNNTSLFVGRTNQSMTLIAHGAIKLSYNSDSVQWNTNTATRILPPEHFYIENTIPAIKAAFSYGADIVEFDIRLTADKQLAVFHDFTVEYRTNGHGLVSENTMAELRQLDVGYGYTADNGQTFPLRGKGVGLMVTIEDVFKAFPSQDFLVHIKDSGEAIGQVLLQFLQTLDPSQLQHVSVYGNDEALDFLKVHYPQLQILSKKKMKKALIKYIFLGWTGMVPKALHNMELHLPIQYAKWLWGWPDKFIQRMDTVNTRVAIVQYEHGWSKGFNSLEDLEQLPKHYAGALWTDRIDIIGPLFKHD
jgi:glycerophosphoryl diester phosphodiesterase